MGKREFEIHGNLMYAFGCNSRWELGRKLPNGTCSMTEDPEYYNNIQTVAEPVQDISIISDRIFKITCTADANTVIVTTENEIFTFGSSHTFITPETSSIPMLIIDNPQGGIEKLDCGHETAWFINLFDALYGWGLNGHFELGIGDSDKHSSPIQITTEIQMFGGNYQNSIYVKKSSPNIMISGTNTYCHLGMNGLNPSSFYSTFNTINMTLINNHMVQGSNYLLLRIWDYGAGVLFDDNFFYSWGCWEPHHIKGTREDTDCTYTVQSPVGNDLSSYIPAGNTVIDIIGNIGMYMIVEDLSQKKWAYSWGCSSAHPSGLCDQSRLGRDMTNWEYPVIMDRGEVPAGDSIEQIGTTGFTVMIITDSGKMYVIGSNLYFGTQIYVLGPSWDYILGTATSFVGLLDGTPGIVGWTGIPRQGYISSRTIGSTYTCNSMLPSRNDICNSHGMCIASDTCKCDAGWTGNECDARTICNGYNSSNPLACNGVGFCESNEKCTCENGYYGDDCEYDYSCYGVDPSASTVCNSKGNCTADNVCNCYISDVIGEECREQITGAKFTSAKKDEIHVFYIAPVAYLSPVNLDDVFSCSLIVASTGNIIGTADCNFFYSSDLTDYLIIEKDGDDGTWKVNVGDTLIIYSVTKPGDTIEVVVEKWDQQKKDLTFWDYLINYWYVFAGVGGALALVVYIGLCVFSIVFCVCVCQKKKISKYEKNEDFQIMLNEEEASTSTDHMASFKIKKDLFRIDYAKIKFIKEIYVGNSGARVFHVKWRDKDCAFKVFQTRVFTSQSVLQSFEREVELSCSLSHPCIIQCYGATLKPPRCGLLLEWCDKGSMFDIVDATMKKKRTPFAFWEKIRILKDVAGAVSFLHSKKIIYRDLKLANVMITGEEMKVKLIDFGISRVVAQDSNMTRNIGTGFYIAPEIVLGKKYNLKADSFSFAMMMYQFYNDTTNPFNLKDQSKNVETKMATDEKYRPKIVDKDYKECEWFKNMMISLWQDDVRHRMEMELVAKRLDKKYWDYKKSTTPQNEEEEDDE